MAYLCTAIAMAAFVGSAANTALAPSVSGPEGLSAGPWGLAVTMQDDENDEFLAEVMPALDNETQQRIRASFAGFVASLTPIFMSMPKNQYGRLGQSPTRYTLHRLFVHRHGWFIKGLYAGQGGATWNSSSVSDLLVQYMPAKAQNAFEKRLDKEGLNLNELTVLAAFIETTIVQKAVDDLRFTYNLTRVPLASHLDKNKVAQLMDVLMMIRMTRSTWGEEYIRQLDIRTFIALNKSISQAYPRWSETQTFMRNLEKEMFPNKAEFVFDDVASIVRELEIRYARWSAVVECGDLKAKLVKIEEGNNTGCARLSDFYNDDINGGNWQFQESPAYLRSLGALDESDPLVPRVIIVNYLESPANCLPSTGYYSACCMSECEDLQLRIETSLQSPTAFPEDIAAVVRTLTPASTPADQSMLSSSLLRRLQEIANLHGGQVPLQGRLFAQWMHFAYPLECPFPHLAGTKHPEEVGGTLEVLETQMVKKSEALWFITKGKGSGRNESHGTCIQWRQEEELFVPTLHPGTTSMGALEQDPGVWSYMYLVWTLTLIGVVMAFAANYHSRYKNRNKSANKLVQFTGAAV